MLEKNKVKGKLFRHKDMQTADFYVTNVTEEGVVGFWIHRKSKQLLKSDVDMIPFNKINPKDWKEVIFS